MVTRILSIIGWLGAGLVFLGAAIRFAFPSQEQYVPYLVWTGLAAVLVYVAGQWRDVAQAFSGRSTRYGALAGASVLTVLGILIAVNYIGARQNKRWDLTANQAFSLSDQSRNVLANLDGPLHMMVFAQEPEFPRYQDRLQQYEYVSDQVTTEYIDPDKRPTVARQYEVQQYGTIVLTFMDRTERVTSDTEQDITNGIIKVITGEQRKVYFVQGHGERDTASSERTGYDSIAAALRSENYTVEPLVLAQTGEVPDDASVVVVAGPKTDFFPPEIEALTRYLDKAGKLLLALDPPETPESPPLTNLIDLARAWGMDVGNDVVVDASGMGRLIGTDASVPVVASYGSHPITERFSYVTAFPLARSVTPIAGGVDGRNPQPFAQTSAQSWAEANISDLLRNGGEVALEEEAGDKPGPVTIAAAVSATASPETGAETPAAEGEPTPEPEEEAPQPETRVAVIGDSDFAANAGLGIQGNRDLFLNTVGWLSQQENLISIRARSPEDRRITLTATQQSNIIWLSLLVIPAFIFGTGVYAWSRRR
jgi:ABC-type uncharacterized transport system involved in gliding motility auxiliary subunit